MFYLIKSLTKPPELLDQSNLYFLSLYVGKILVRLILKLMAAEKSDSRQFEKIGFLGDLFKQLIIFQLINYDNYLAL